MPTKGEMESWVYDDYHGVLGQTFFVKELTGYVDDNSVDFTLKTPAKVKVVKTGVQSLMHWNDEWLDPYWELELLEPHPELAGARSFWMFGDSYSTDGKYQPARYEPRRGPREWSPRSSFDRKRKR